MSTIVEWFGGTGAAGTKIQPAASGGLNTAGFFGASFGFSIRVGEYNASTFRTSSDGTTNGGSLPNLKWYNVSGVYAGVDIVPQELLNVENEQATLNIRMTTDSAVKTQNTKFRAYDRVSIDNAPSGITIKACELRKDNALVRGSGDTNWTTIGGSADVLSLADQTTGDFTIHNWYVGLTATPNNIGAKLLSLYVESEFL